MTTLQTVILWIEIYCTPGMLMMAWALWPQGE